MMINVVAVITAHPGQRKNILDILVPQLPGHLEEMGCLEYNVTIDTEVVGHMHTQSHFGPDTFVIVEKWASLEQLSAHSIDPNIQGYLASIEPFLASRVAYFTSTEGGFVTPGAVGAVGRAERG